MENEMRKTIIALVAALGISMAAVAPAKAQFWGGYGGWGGGWGGYGWGGYGAGLGIAAGAGLLGGIIGGAIASQSYGYGGYGGYGYYAPTYYYPQTYYVQPQPTRKVIIKKRVRDPVYIEEDYYGY